MPIKSKCITLRPEQWDVILGLIEEKQAHLELYVKNRPKAITKTSRFKIGDLEEILMDIADQHFEDEEE